MVGFLPEQITEIQAELSSFISPRICFQRLKIANSNFYDHSKNVVSINDRADQLHGRLDLVRIQVTITITLPLLREIGSLRI